jgi:hypothetical protein
VAAIKTKGNTPVLFFWTPGHDPRLRQSRKLLAETVWVHNKLINFSY